MGAAGATTLAGAPQKAGPETMAVVQVPDRKCDPREVERRRAARGGERASVRMCHQVGPCNLGMDDVCSVSSECHEKHISGPSTWGKVGEASAHWHQPPHWSKVRPLGGIST